LCQRDDNGRPVLDQADFGDIQNPRQKFFAEWKAKGLPDYLIEEKWEQIDRMDLLALERMRELRE
jgi:hypothetical protein